MAKAKESSAAKPKAKEVPAPKAKPKETPAKETAKAKAPAAKPAPAKPEAKKPVKEAAPAPKPKPASGRVDVAKPASGRIEAPKPVAGKSASGRVEAPKSASGRIESPKPATDKSASGRVEAPKSASGRIEAAKAKAPARERNGSDRNRDVRLDGKPLVGLKCPFPTDELSKWRQVLLERRAEITSDIAGLVKDAMEAEDGHTTPNHIAERGSDADLQDMSLGMAGEEEHILWQIDRALRKIDQSSPIPYGLCEYTREPIPRTRLQLLPWTPLSIEGAQHMEDARLTLEDMLLDD